LGCAVVTAAGNPVDTLSLTPKSVRDTGLRLTAGELFQDVQHLLVAEGAPRVAASILLCVLKDAGDLLAFPATQPRPKQCGDALDLFY
jgi:hypothetical protein